MRRLAFEVATIKESEPVSAMNGRVSIRIGVRNDGAIVTYSRMTLKGLVQNAYSVKDYQVTGAPWMDTVYYDISAKMPDGANKDQAPEMLQTLLKERFHVALHRETKEHPVFAIVVAKGGPKLKPAEAAQDAGPGAAAAPKSLDGPGRGAPPEGAMTIRMSSAGGEVEGRAMTLPRFAEMISRYLERPAVDETGIQGKYDFKLEISPEEMRNASIMKAGMAMAFSAHGPMPGGDGGAPPPQEGGGASILQSIQAYGLKLEPKKAPMETIIIDSADKTPAEN